MGIPWCTPMQRIWVVDSHDESDIIYVAECFPKVHKVPASLGLLLLSYYTLLLCVVGGQASGLAWMLACLHPGSFHAFHLRLVLLKTWGLWICEIIEDGQWHSQSSGDGGEISCGRPPWLTGPLPKNENLSFLAHFIFEGPLLDLGRALLSLKWALWGLKLAPQTWLGPFKACAFFIFIECWQ